jgi:hypothetical protein
MALEIRGPNESPSPPHNTRWPGNASQRCCQVLNSSIPGPGPGFVGPNHELARPLSNCSAVTPATAQTDLLSGYAAAVLQLHCSCYCATAASNAAAWSSRLARIFRPCHGRVRTSTRSICLSSGSHRNASLPRCAAAPGSCTCTIPAAALAAVAPTQLHCRRCAATAALLPCCSTPAGPGPCP